MRVRSPVFHSERGNRARPQIMNNRRMDSDSLYGIHFTQHDALSIRR